MNKIFDLDYSHKNKNEIKNKSKKLLIISFFMTIFGMIIIMRLFEITMPYKKANINKLDKKIEINKENRGLLLDRNNRILASNIYI